MFLSFFGLPMQHQVTPKKILNVRFLGSFSVLYQGGAPNTPLRVANPQAADRPAGGWSPKERIVMTP
jgi:hypothetical protein